MNYPFTELDSQRAYETWHANCGPNALAFALGIHIELVRGKIPGFDEKQYTSPTMMKQALANLRQPFEAYAFPRFVAAAFHPKYTSLVRIQWSGPWTAEGANPKWAYRQTHWIATYLDIAMRNEPERARMVFDVNGGIRTYASWVKEIVPLLTQSIKRADGGFWPTHVWRILK